MLLSVDGLTINYESAGSGAPVVILHGWGGTLDSVRPIFHCLSRSHQAFVLDLPGFGESPQPSSTWGTSEYANRVGGFMDAVGCPQAHILGHSFGGRIAIVLAAQDPERVDRLVLVDSAGIRPTRTWRYHARAKLTKAARSALRLLPVPRLREAVMNQVYGLLGSADYRNAGPMRDIFVRVVNEDLAPLLPAIRARSLLVWGEEDQDVPLAQGEIMAREIPGARLEVLSGAGHFSYIDRLPRFCQLVRDFLKEEP